MLPINYPEPAVEIDGNEIEFFFRIIAGHDGCHADNRQNDEDNVVENSDNKHGDEITLLM
jgi:hypothetical protein